MIARAWSGVSTSAAVLPSVWVSSRRAEDDRRKLDDVAGHDLCGGLHALAVDVRPVRAVQVAKPQLVAFHEEFGVQFRNAPRIQAERGFRHASDGERGRIDGEPPDGTRRVGLSGQIPASGRSEALGRSGLGVIVLGGCHGRVSLGATEAERSAGRGRGGEG